MLQFAQDEIVLPSGKFAGRRFSVHRNPFSALWLNAIDSGVWRRFFFTGPQQAGKSLHGAMIPLVYHLFEKKESVIFGVPSLDMVADKWNDDILPIIERTKYRELLPRRGPGSRGGKNVKFVQFGNGTFLRFMTGGGGDKGRAGKTSRVVIVTEVDGLDEAGEKSREADKITQLEGRTSSFGEQALFYGECTVSIETGRTWQEYTQGTESRIAIRCQHCQVYVTPEREHLIGWREAEDVLSAGEQSSLVCPNCGAAWSEEDRTLANVDCRLLHKGQTIDGAGVIQGDAPRTNTLGFRFTPTNNLLTTISVIGEREWKAARHSDEDLAERGMRQFVWALPHESNVVDLNELDWQVITKRTTKDPKGRVPSGTVRIGLGVDVGKWLLHWVLVAFTSDGTPHTVDYGRSEVASSELGTEKAILVALRSLREMVDEGWPSDIGPIQPDIKIVDAGNWDQVVIDFCKESGEDWIPAKGFGLDQRKSSYANPRQTGKTIAFIGSDFYIARLPKKKTRLCHIDANSRKRWLHDCLATPVGRPGAMTLFNPESKQSKEHTSIAKHWTAEQMREEFSPGRGTVIVFYVVHRNNHYLDAACMAGVAGEYAASRALKRRVYSRDAMVHVSLPSQTESQDIEEDTTEPEQEKTTYPQTESWFAKRKRR